MEAMLPLAGLKPRGVAKDADAAVPFVVIEDILPNAAFLLHVAIRVFEQRGNRNSLNSAVHISITAS